MADTKITVQMRDADLDKLVAKLKKLEDKIKKKIVIDAMMAGGKIHLEAAKVLVPVKTGELKKSLRIRRATDRQMVGARVLAQRGKDFPGGYYAHLVEKGHHIFRKTRSGKKIYVGYYSGKPFMRPAVEMNFERIISKIKETAKAGVDATVKSL